MIASDQEKLLEELDGYEVSGPKSERLSTAGTEIDDQGMTIPFQLLEVLVDPNVVAPAAADRDPRAGSGGVRAGDDHPRRHRRWSRSSSA